MDKRQKTKILYVLATFEIGGAERHYTELIKRIDRSRFDVLVCCLSKRGKLLQELEDVDGEIVDLNLDEHYWQRFGPALWKLCRLIRRERVDIVHTYLFYADLIGATAAKLARRPSIIVSKRALDTTWMKRKHIAMSRLVNSCADRITAVSDAVARCVAERENVPEAKLVRIYNGADFEKLSHSESDRVTARNAMGIADNVPVIGTVAHLTHKKGHRYLLEAARLIKASFPNAVFLWVGGGRQENELRKLAAQWQLNGNVRFLGYRSDVPALLEAMDLFVLPSLEEGMSNALLEAMAKNIPVIATAVGGNIEVVEHEKSGLLVPPRDPAALAEAITRIIREPSLAGSMARAGSERVKDRFTIENTIRSIEELYEELMNHATAAEGN